MQKFIGSWNAYLINNSQNGKENVDLRPYSNNKKLILFMSHTENKINRDTLTNITLKTHTLWPSYGCSSLTFYTVIQIPLYVYLIPYDVSRKTYLITYSAFEFFPTIIWGNEPCTYIACRTRVDTIQTNELLEKHKMKVLRSMTGEEITEPDYRLKIYGRGANIN